VTSKERAALIELIETFKPAEVSTLDATLNVLISHAETISAQAKEIRELQKAMADAGERLVKRSQESQQRQERTTA